MSNYTKINFSEVQDSAAGRSGAIEARFGRKHMNSEHLGVTQFRFGAGARPPFGHRHREQEEAYVVTSGSGRVKLDDEIVDLKQGDLLRVAPHVVRAFEAGPDGLELIAVGNDRPEGGDGEMVEEFWTD
jgi:quercetin dioxygenase-like cupin family protein